MTNVMKMSFKEATTGKKLTWTLADPKSTVTKMQVANMMNKAINDEVVIIQGETQTIEIDDAYIYQTQKIELA